jgi:hypothetical protein
MRSAVVRRHPTWLKARALARVSPSSLFTQHLRNIYHDHDKSTIIAYFIIIFADIRIIMKLAVFSTLIVAAAAAVIPRQTGLKTFTLQAQGVAPDPLPSFGDLQRLGNKPQDVGGPIGWFNATHTPLKLFIQYNADEGTAFDSSNTARTVYLRPEDADGLSEVVLGNPEVYLLPAILSLTRKVLTCCCSWSQILLRCDLRISRYMKPRLPPAKPTTCSDIWRTMRMPGSRARAPMITGGSCFLERVQPRGVARMPSPWRCTIPAEVAVRTAAAYGKGSAIGGCGHIMVMSNGRRLEV